jgi:hypothetical protein
MTSETHEFSGQTPVLSKKVPLTLHVNGAKYEIGEATVRSNGTAEFLITDEKVRITLGIAGGELTFGFDPGNPSAESECSATATVSPYKAAQIEYFFHPYRRRPWND